MVNLTDRNLDILVKGPSPGAMGASAPAGSTADTTAA